MSKKNLAPYELFVQILDVSLKNVLLSRRKEKLECVKPLSGTMTYAAAKVACMGEEETFYGTFIIKGEILDHADYYQETDRVQIGEGSCSKTHPQAGTVHIISIKFLY